MFAVYARYRGESTRRADLVAQSAAALARLDGCSGLRVVDVEDIAGPVDGPIPVATLVLALIAGGGWAIGIGVSPAEAEDTAARALGHSRAGSIGAVVEAADSEGTDLGSDIAAVFTLLQHVISRRSPEGREATALMRAGHAQVEAAAELGISKQAMSQRLATAGWHAEEAGWLLAVHLLSRAAEVRPRTGGYAPR